MIPLGAGQGTAPANAGALELRDVSVRYGERVVLDGVSLAVERGTVYALLGRNGAGKSSLIRCLLGTQRPQRGTARLLGMDAWTDRARALARVGVVPEEPDAPPHLSPRALAHFCSQLYPRWNQAAVTRRLDRFGVPLGTAFGDLSKGQKGHTLLALAFGHEPELLVLDDPTLGLDAVARRAVFDELIGELAERGTTVLLASHDMAGVERIAQRVGILAGGRLQVDDDIDELRRRFRRLRGPASLGDEHFAPHAPLQVRTLAWGREAIVSRFDAQRFAVVSSQIAIEAETLSLEEIFVSLTGEAPL